MVTIVMNSMNHCAITIIHTVAMYCLQVTPYAARYFPVTFSVIQPYVRMSYDCICVQVYVYICILYECICT